MLAICHAGPAARRDCSAAAGTRRVGRPRSRHQDHRRRGERSGSAACDRRHDCRAQGLPDRCRSLHPAGGARPVGAAFAHAADDAMIAVVAALLPVFLLIITGFLLRHWLIAEDAHWVGLERLLYYVMFPALLVESLSRADLSKVPVLAIGGTLLAAVLLMAALCLALRPMLARTLNADGATFTSLFQ